MSWSIHAKGTVGEVRDVVRGTDCYEQRHGIPDTNNEKQFMLVKGALTEELLRIPADWEADLQASGHSDDYYSSLRVTLNVSKPSVSEEPANEANQGN